MPNTREKLIELIYESTGVTYGGEYGDVTIQEEIDINDEEIERIADHLIANGVTVQEWISVKDRLPEDDSDVLAYLRIGEIGRIYPANYANGMWFDCMFNTPATDTTTHWMPLPEPPKENE